MGLGEVDVKNFGGKMRVHYSSKRMDWETPDKIFDDLNKEFAFTLDPCAGHENAKCINYFTKEDDGLNKSWGQETVFMNPPYGREIGKWMQKAYEESLNGAVIVCLIPSRTDTRWWHSYATKGEVRFIKGRIKFKGGKNCAPFPSAIVIFGKNF